MTIHRVSQNPDLFDFIRDREINVVIDVGANIGQFGRYLRANDYKGKIISFEPIESEFRTLSRSAEADGNWEAHHCGLGAASGEALINVSELSVFSSILVPSSVAIQFDKRAAVERTETVRLNTLDEIAVGMSDKILLKIDTQGYEKQVIEGGRQLVPRVQGIWMELPINHLYEGTWKFHEAVSFMEKTGFVPSQFHPVSYDPKNRMSLIEVDCLFVPA